MNASLQLTADYKVATAMDWRARQDSWLAASYLDAGRAREDLDASHSPCLDVHVAFHPAERAVTADACQPRLLRVRPCA